MGNNGNKQTTLQGIIVFLSSDIGSKSEAKIPFLYINRENMIRLFKRGDNPFENRAFNDYDGKYVEVLGELILENKFKVHSIRIINKERENEMP